MIGALLVGTMSGIILYIISKNVYVSIVGGVVLYVICFNRTAARWAHKEDERLVEEAKRKLDKKIMIKQALDKYKKEKGWS